MKNKLTQWKTRLQKKSDEELFRLFGEKKRINLYPQIEAGNILYKRQYDLQKLTDVKTELISELEQRIERKHGGDQKEIEKNMIINIVGRHIIFAFITSLLFLFLLRGHGDKFKFILLIIAFNLFPLIFMKRLKARELKSIQRQMDQNKEQILVIKNDLLF